MLSNHGILSNHFPLCHINFNVSFVSEKKSNKLLWGPMSHCPQYGAHQARNLISQASRHSMVSPSFWYPIHFCCPPNILTSSYRYQSLQRVFPNLYHPSHNPHSTHYRLYLASKFMLLKWLLYFACLPPPKSFKSVSHWPVSHQHLSLHLYVVGVQ